MVTLKANAGEMHQLQRQHHLHFLITLIVPLPKILSGSGFSKNSIGKQSKQVMHIEIFLSNQSKQLCSQNKAITKSLQLTLKELC